MKRGIFSIEDAIESLRFANTSTNSVDVYNVTQIVLGDLQVSEVGMMETYTWLASDKRNLIDFLETYEEESDLLLGDILQSVEEDIALVKGLMNDSNSTDTILIIFIVFSCIGVLGLTSTIAYVVYQRKSRTHTHLQETTNTVDRIIDALDESATQWGMYQLVSFLLYHQTKQ